jgi:lysophospholipase L1-like esterase
MSLRFMVGRPARAFAAAVMLVVGATGGVIGATAASASTPLYYVAMGDSLGAGVGASPISNSYVNQIYQHELARIPGLVLKNFSCSGATTASVINGPNCVGAATQLALAKAFLKAHKGHVAFVSIDIGANDVDGCSNGTTTSTACMTNGLAAVNTNLPQILSALKSVYPGIRIVGMNYYDPFLASWLTGPSGEALAQQSLTLSDSFNSLLTSVYAAAGFPTAGVATAFLTDALSLTGTYNSQTEPENVANVCN